MSEYRSVNARALHPDTRELVCFHYWDLHQIYPNSTPIQQIYNAIVGTPDLGMAIEKIQRSSQKLLADMRAYPDDAYELGRFLPFLEDFCELVQETSARLHNREPAKREAYERVSALLDQLKQAEETARTEWQRFVEAGDAYFGAPGAYLRLLNARYSETGAKEWEAIRDRLRAFREAYEQGTLPPAQTVTEPTQANLWMEEIQ